jgi:hypothetical protein
MNKTERAARDGLRLTRAGQWRVATCRTWKNSRELFHAVLGAPSTLPVQWARLALGARVPGCSGPRTRLIDRQQRGVVVPGGGRVPRMTGPAGEAGADGEGARVLRP